jgi:hypothetical protein
MSQGDAGRSDAQNPGTSISLPACPDAQEPIEVAQQKVEVELEVQAVRDLFGSRFGGTWFANSDDGTTTFTVGVVNPTKEEIDA